MPGYEQARRIAREAPTAVTGGALTVTWMDGGTAFQYTSGGKLYRYDIASAQAKEVETSDAEAGRGAPIGRGGRGQFTGTPGAGPRTAVRLGRRRPTARARRSTGIAISG